VRRRPTMGWNRRGAKVWPLARWGQSLESRPAVQPSVGQAVAGSKRVHQTKRARLVLEALPWVLGAVYLYGSWAIRRSERWQAAGLCTGCGAEGPSIEVGGNNYCEVCAPAARKNLEGAGQFFVFMGAFLAIALSVILLEGWMRPGEFMDLKVRAGLAAIFAMGVALWIHRKMKGKAIL